MRRLAAAAGAVAAAAAVVALAGCTTATSSGGGAATVGPITLSGPGSVTVAYTVSSYCAYTWTLLTGSKVKVAQIGGTFGPVSGSRTGTAKLLSEPAGTYLLGVGVAHTQAGATGPCNWKLTFSTP